MTRSPRKVLQETCQKGEKDSALIYKGSPLIYSIKKQAALVRLT